MNEPTHKENVTAVVQEARSSLDTILGESGTILYSSCETLKPGKYYFLGVNPGGSEAGTDTIEESLNKLGALSKDAYENAYLEQCWCNKPDCKGCCRPLQKRFEYLFEQLGVNPLSVCASNLIFKRSRGEKDAGGWEMARTCWPVHEVVLQMVQPRVIITFGKLPFDFIRFKLVGTAPDQENCGYGKWTCRYSRLKTDQMLIGLPHLSRYALQNNPKVIGGIRTYLGLSSVAAG